MRRHVAGLLLVLFAAQSSGAALANAPEKVIGRVPRFALASIIQPLFSVIEGSQILAQLTGQGDRYSLMHMPKPRFMGPAVSGTPEYDVNKAHWAKGYSRPGIREVVAYPAAPPRQFTRDPLAMGRASASGHMRPSQSSSPQLPGAPTQHAMQPGLPNAIRPRVSASSAKTSSGIPGTIGNQLFPMKGQGKSMSPQMKAASDAGAGINPWWSYEEHPIPGIGNAMLNVGTGNLVIQATDVSIPERGLGLVMQRTYNSQSLHDASGDDGAEPDIYGNGWTNTYDAHIVFRGTGQTPTAISVYDTDGTRCDYTPDTNDDGGWTPCTGEHAILQVDPNNACSYFWTKKTGTVYWFHSDNPQGCSFFPAGTGRVYKIFGRNSNNYITFNYSYSGPEKTTNEITEIDINHSDGHSLILKFQLVGGTPASPSPPNELASVTRPDGLSVNYYYDVQGDLKEVDHPGNNAASVLPQTYGVQNPIQYACGPRATIAKQPGNGNDDGACMNFDYNSSVNLIDWKVNGELNIDPGDNYGRIQSGPHGWQTWYTANFVYGYTSGGPPCGHTTGGTTTMCDSDGHSTIWTINSLSQVTQTQAFTGVSSSLITKQTWDANNNLVATIDASTNETDYAYDANGNTVAVARPRPTSGKDRPTYLYAYDQHNNLLSYCDPVYSSQNGLDWNSGTYGGAGCPGGAGTTHFQWTSPSDGSEPYGHIYQLFTACYNAGCIDHFSSISEPGYHIIYTYTTYGLLYTANGDTIPQPAGSRTPTQTFGYDQFGNLTSYNNGGGTWILNYDNLNRLASREDPDPGTPTSHLQYYSDGTVSLTETPYQHSLSKGHAFTYDADSDETSQTVHRNGTEGTIVKYYDGLDRLVEIKQPYSSNSDVFTNPWFTRYFYDLSEGATQTFNNSPPFSAYGNLFAVEELLPSSGYKITYNGGQVSNGSFEPLRGVEYDALDRVVGEYSIINSNNALATTTYDGASGSGLPSKECQPIQTLCRTFAYDNDDRLTSISYSDNSVRNFTYDPASHQLTAQNADGTQNFWYDLEGRITNTEEPNLGPNTAQATYTHELYADGKVKQLDVASNAFGTNGNGLFLYQYTATGRLGSLTVTYNPKNVNVAVGFQYTPADRLQKRTETGSGAYSNPTTMNYDTFGQLSAVTYPNTVQISNYQYNPEGDLLSFGNEGSGGPYQAFSYTIRGELESAGSTGFPVGNPGSFMFADGVQVQTAGGTGILNFSSQWDDRMGVMSSLSTNQSTYPQMQNSFTYDGAGRETSSSSISCSDASCSAITSGSGRSYDIDNHTVDTKQQWTNGTQQSANVSVYNWGPADHPVRIGSADSVTSTPPPDSSANFDTLHWDGDQLIFETNSQGSLDDIKVGTAGDITPQDPIYKGITFWDRGPGGAVVYCHNASGTAGTGQVEAVPVLMSWGGSPCSVNQTGTFPNSIEWFEGPIGIGALNGKPRVGGVGQGAVVGMYRPDGISDGANAIQGVRTTDSNSGTWTTPDAFGWFVDDPQSQNAYSWLGNNPLGYQDPSGFDDVPCCFTSGQAPDTGTQTCGPGVTVNADGSCGLTILNDQFDQGLFLALGEFGDLVEEWRPRSVTLEGELTAPVSPVPAGVGVHGEVTFTCDHRIILATGQQVASLGRAGSVTVSNSIPDGDISVGGAGFLILGGSYAWDTSSGQGALSLGLGVPGVSAGGTATVTQFPSPIGWRC